MTTCSDIFCILLLLFDIPNSYVLKKKKRKKNCLMKIGSFYESEGNGDFSHKTSCQVLHYLYMLF